jgi:transglutaminase-like putative cysteine protease
MSWMTEFLGDVVGRWRIRHETAYRYDTQVAFAPHVLRLTPQGERVRCLSRSVHVSPSPVAMSDFSDAFGNSCTRIGFGPEQTSELIVESRVEVQTFARPRLDDSSLPQLPWYTQGHDELLAYRQAGDGPEVAALAERLARAPFGAPLAFFELLNHTLYTTLDRQLRVEGHAQTPAETLRIGRGACRDLTVLFLAVCRHLGVAGRFVSGYQGQEASPDGKRHLHAWPELFLPGLGWLGWDPTHGVPVGPGHVALCAAPTQAGTMPIEGGFYFNGPTVTSTLGYSITFEAI